jgi:hypothetical protein
MKVKLKPGQIPFDVSTGTKSIRVDENTSAEDLADVYTLIGDDERLAVSKTAKELAEENKQNNE